MCFGARNGLFRTRPRPWGTAPWTGAFLLGQTVVLLPAMLSGSFLELKLATEATLQLLFLLAGFTALMFGYIARMLEQREAAEDSATDPPAMCTVARRPPPRHWRWRPPVAHGCVLGARSSSPVPMGGTAVLRLERPQVHPQGGTLARDEQAEVDSYVHRRRRRGAGHLDGHRRDRVSGTRDGGRNRRSDVTDRGTNRLLGPHASSRTSPLLAQVEPQPAQSPTSDDVISCVADHMVKVNKDDRGNRGRIGPVLRQQEGGDR